MTQYIDKSVLVAEIKRMRDKAYPISDWNHGYVKACETIISLLDTIETKDVDLNNDIKNAFKAGYELGIQQKTQKG